MRIQHNIPAMNSYRNYTHNTSMVNKSLEKLSSGYRINRAGDDAAGLAISEKMRAQISGLEQAQSNAKSGINLVQTAEGALTEVHDMLNRMYTLAEQSANGTYDDSVDRNQMQKEIASLKTEIDRIADSANFNGIKLLDGALDGNVKIGADNMSRLKLTGINSFTAGTSATTAKWEEGIVTHKDASGASKSSFEIELGTLTANKSGTTNGTLNVSLFQAPKDFGKADGTASDGASKIMAIKGDDGEYAETRDIAVTVTGEMTATEIGREIMKQLDQDKDGIATIKLMAGAAANTTNGDKATMVEYNVSFDEEKGVLRFEMSDDGYKLAATEATKAGGSDKYFASNFSFRAEPDANATVTGMKNYGATNTVDGSAASATRLAHTMITFPNGNAEHSGVAIQDGAGFKLGDEMYVFAASDRTFNASYGSNVKVVDLRDIAEALDGKQIDFANEGSLKGVPSKSVGQALNRLAEAAKDNKMWDVQVNNFGGAIYLNEKASYSGDADLTTKQGIHDQVQGFKINWDTAYGGKALTLQIGDTSEKFNQMGVNVEDMHVAAMGIGDIDISSQEGAAAAVSRIKDAVNYVSNTRGTLGALQNRLDHTINNLGVMQENIQDAESTIRDVDIAKEMMSYTKNSILVQSAQAMLAQANQLPQGVLQLLG